MSESIMDQIENIQQGSMGNAKILVVGVGTLTFQPGDKAISIELDDATQGALTIVGYGGTFEIDAAGVDRAFSIKSGTVKLGAIAISNGSADFGGAIANAGDLYLEDAVLSDNVASVSGGALADKGWISIENSRLLGNEAAENGAAIYRGDFEFATEEVVAPEATGTIADVSAAFGKTVEIDLTKYFSEGDWTYSVQFATDASDALAAEPVVENGVLKLTFVDEATYLEEIEIKEEKFGTSIPESSRGIGTLYQFNDDSNYDIIINNNIFYYASNKRIYTIRIFYK